MKETFAAHFLSAVLNFEGGFTNNPDDSGGPTNYGITQSEWDAWRRAEGLPVTNVQNIPMAAVQHIYKRRYWDAVDGDDLPYPIDWITADCAVNCGAVTAVHLLERAIGDPLTAKLTPAVLEQIRQKCTTLDGLHLLKTVELSERITLYYQIVASHPKDQEFLRGWLNRVEELRKDT